MFGVNSFNQTFRSQQIFDSISILNCESNIYPLVFQGRNKNSISMWTIIVSWKPYFKIPRTMNAPFSIFKCGLQDSDAFDIIYFHILIFSCWKIIIVKKEVDPIGWTA